MKLTYFFLFLFVILLGISLIIPARFYKQQNVLRDPDYLKTDLPIESRINDLLSHMTLEEKAGQMALVEKNSVDDLSEVGAYGIGALLSGAGANPENNSPEGWQDMVRKFLQASRESRLGIPILYGVDAVHGHANIPGATVFPHAIGLGATGNPELVKRIAEITTTELRATNVNWTYSPNLDLPRDIRWGRTYETFSNDPLLTASLGAAFLEGTQQRSDGDLRLAMLSTPKHYVGAGGMIWGTPRSEEYKIDQGTTPANDAVLRTEYAVPFKAAVDAGALSIMVGLNSWGDTKLAASKYLVTDVLKGEFGFTGFTVSDWFGVYEIPGSDYEAAVTAINAGIDMVMLPFDFKPFIRHVVQAVERGDISEERIDDAVRRILRAKFAIGLFDPEEEVPPLSVIGSAEHRAVAREAAAESLVLLKNEGSILPIKADVKHLRIAGSAADNVGRQTGAWTVEWQGIDGNWLPGATSILSAIRSHAGDGIRVEFDENGSFFPDEMADLGIAIVGESPYAEGFGDRSYPSLEQRDIEAIAKLKLTCKRVVVVIVSGRPLFIDDHIDGWDALVEAWLPGSEGDGVADVLFGDSPFIGRLPLPWPHGVEQLPIGADGTTRDGREPLFPRYFAY